MREERQAKMAMARNFRQAGMSLREIADRLDVSRETVRLWLSNTERSFYEDVKQKAAARPKVVVGKKRPRQLVTLSAGPWWREAPAVVWVDIITGQVLVNRWPLE
ncbi:MAG: helix-turn-helix domain-containing protein [Thermoanaerobacter sp.]|nr:helix-turn-helix domain-containing protein [Thermoanaerobacter sp.]